MKSRKTLERMFVVLTLAVTGVCGCTDSEKAANTNSGEPATDEVGITKSGSNLANETVEGWTSELKAVGNTSKDDSVNPVAHSNGDDSEAAISDSDRSLPSAANHADDMTLQLVNKAIQRKPGTNLYIVRAGLYAVRGEFGKTNADLSRAVQIDPKSSIAHSTLAWLQATCPDAEYRDGRKAVENAREACELTKWNDESCVSSLAAAYAECGEFDEAVKWIQKAMEMAPNSESKKTRNKMLEFFKVGKPYRN